MKFSFNLLKRYFEFNNNYSASKLGEIITNLGFEVEEIEDLSLKYKNFIVAKIIEATKHPESEKLSICKVETGNEVLNIICGAKNARTGIKVVLAKIGAIVPVNGLEIKKGLIRGVESEGMLCSSYELSLNDEADGIIELPETAVVGLNFATFLEMEDSIFHIAITPNRGDGASIKGILRDLQAKEIGVCKPLLLSNNFNFAELNVKIEDKTPLCNVNFAKAKLGEFKEYKELSFYNKIWGSSKLFAVDVSNFIMFLTGAPNHIYDASKIQGKISISRTAEGEFFVPIKGDEMKLPSGLLVVRDEVKILSLLGVMGDARSKVDENTKEVVVEVLHVTPNEVINSSRKTGIKSDSSYRFERGVDYTIQHDVCVEILTKLEAQNIELFSLQADFTPLQISFNLIDYKAKIGIEVTSAEAEKILTKLGFNPAFLEDNIICIVPPFRSDITIKEDIYEEITRIIGFEKINPIPIPNLKSVKNYDLSLEIKKILQRSAREVITYSFFRDEYFGLFSSSKQKLSLKNPITTELSVMRESLIPNLLENTSNNEKKSYFNTAIFEVGTVFFGTQKEEQQLAFAGVFAGFETEKTFLTKEIPFSIWHAKQKMIEVLFEVWGFTENALTFKPLLNENFHTTQSFEVCMGKIVIGILAQIHPLTLDKFEIKQKVFAFEILAEKLPTIKKKKLTYKEDILPDVLREIAIILPNIILFEQVLNAIKRLRILEIKEIAIKDIFEDVNRIGSNLKSISLQFRIKQEEETLKKEQIDGIIDAITNALSKEFNSKLRDGEEAK